jgi:hypothetical protein
MKNNFSEIATPETIEIKVDSIEQHSRQRESGKIKGKSILRFGLKTPVSGYGRCRSCECKGYISKHNGSHECKKCNHHFDRHWD